MEEIFPDPLPPRGEKFRSYQPEAQAVPVNSIT